MEDPTKGTPPLPPRVGHVLRLAEIIRELGVCITSHGAAALAEAILAHPGFSGCHDGPAALPAQEQGEGLSDQEIINLADFDAGFDRYDTKDESGNEGVTWECSNSQLLHFARLVRQDCPASPTTPQPLPSGYIDAEHQGEDRKLLKAYYDGLWAEAPPCNWSDRVLRGIRAVIALRPTVAAVRAADAAIADEALEAEFRAWWKASAHSLSAPPYHAIYTTDFLAWGRHLLSRGEL